MYDNSDNISPCFRRLPFSNNTVTISPPGISKKIKIWRPSRVGDLTEEHFSTPRRAKRNFHVMSSKCKEYKQKIAYYRNKTCRLQKKVKKLESLLSHLCEKNLLSEDAAANISVSITS